MPDPMESRPLQRLRELAQAEAEAAELVFGPIIADAGELIAQRWGEPLPSRFGSEGFEPTRWPAFEAQFPTHSRGAVERSEWAQARFEWSFGMSELRRERPGEIAFSAGVAAPIEEQPLPIEAEAWLAERRREGFQDLRNRRLGLVRVVRWLYPEELMQAVDADEQAQYLGGWVVSVFEHLEEQPPPR